jgi:transposase
MVSMEEQKKRRTRRKFTDEYKARAVRLVLKEGQTAAQVARDLDLIESVLHSWVVSVRRVA